jgi:glycosyltransferase involved in cell wall biosynthesis
MTGNVDLICLSHLRWNFVYQRPNHLMSRCAKERRVFFFEEPIFDAESPSLEISEVEPNLFRATPHLPASFRDDQKRISLKQLLDEMIEEWRIKQFMMWLYTPMALEFCAHLEPSVTIFDCMDELSAFAGAPKILRDHETELFSRANVVFTGGVSLYESKRKRHHNVHAMPSSVDRAHFGRARSGTDEPKDQATIAHPKMGFFGVIDERMDIDLIRGIAEARPDWQIVLIGPVVKIDPASLPRLPNIHYLGQKSYADLPAYLSGWDVALLPFALNEATRFISPTKTPEYLAAGCPVVSTAIQDVVRPYGERGLVRIAADVPSFVEAIEAALREGFAPKQADVDEFLRDMSWDETWKRMSTLIDEQLARTRVEEAKRTARPRTSAAEEEESCSII